MTIIPQPEDPTLQAANNALEEEYNADNIRRGYLGVSAIGDVCDRKLWYGFRWAKERHMNAKSIRAIVDGHHGESLQAERLRRVPGVALITEEESTGKQFEYVWFGGHLRGHPDGVITGLLQAPKAKHIWEHKQVNEKKFNNLTKCKNEYGEKEALKKWDEVYYAQAVLCMHFEGVDRHYLTVATPGGRDTISCRTEGDEKYALMLIEKAERIIFADEAPARLSNNPSLYLCNWCDFKDICHEKVTPALSCRTCLHSTPEREGGWSCAKLGKQNVDSGVPICGGNSHLYLPSMLDGNIKEVDTGAVIYEDGRINYEGGRVE